MGLFIVPIVLIQLPWILPQLIFTYFTDTIGYIFSGDFFEDFKTLKDNGDI
mgnify:FL=1